jgi:F-type H+-transporting ATPase subunit epsilon
MTRAMRLTITTPNAVLFDGGGVRSIRAEDQSGGFGLLPGHADFLTVLPASVIRWRAKDGVERFCAIRSGVLTIKDGERVAVACRHGVLGDDLQKLEAEVHSARATQIDATARARVEQTRLHANAVRQLIRYLRPAGLSEAALFTDEGKAP